MVHKVVTGPNTRLCEIIKQEGRQLGQATWDKKCKFFTTTTMQLPKNTSFGSKNGRESL